MSNTSAACTSDRLGMLVEANIIAVHAYQIILRLDSGRGDEKSFSQEGISREKLLAVVDLQKKLLGYSIDEIKRWTAGEAEQAGAEVKEILNSGLKLDNRLPVSVFTSYLMKKTNKPKVEIRALANLLQLVLESERDGDVFQNIMDLYIGLGLPVYMKDFGFEGSDEDFLEAGKDLEAVCCEAPFDTDAAAWQISGRKVWNWAEKKLHIRDAVTVAKELLEEDDVKALIPAIKAMPKQRIAVVGHSFTMDQHWSSPSSFTEITAAIFGIVNPSVEFKHFTRGGLKAERAYTEKLAPALEFKPDRMLFVFGVRPDCKEDLESIVKIAEETGKVGIKPYFFDNLHDPFDLINLEQTYNSVKNAGFTIIEVDAVISNSPEKDKFFCLDGMHMTEPYHRLMAKEWLKFLTGQRKAEL